MYPLILCYCGRCLSDIYDLYMELRTRRFATAYAGLGMDIDPVQIAITGEIDISMGDDLDKLNLHCDCCRSHILTQVQFKELY